MFVKSGGEYVQDDVEKLVTDQLREESDIRTPEAKALWQNMQERASSASPWSTRIPAAIAKAEKLDFVGDLYEQAWGNKHITATEVQLAKALYDKWGEHYSEADEWLYPALRAFCEKVESLD